MKNNNNHTSNLIHYLNKINIKFCQFSLNFCQFSLNFCYLDNIYVLHTHHNHVFFTFANDYKILIIL